MKPSWQSQLLNLLLKIFIRAKFAADKNPSEVRESTLKMMNRFKFLNRSTNTNVQLTNISLNGLPCQQVSSGVYDESKAILYFHGGGFYLPAVSVHTQFVSILSESLQARAFIPDYRLCPEHPFPAATSDCLISYEVLLEQGFKAENIVFAGDSAGGNLVMTTLMSARDKGLPMPACATLLSPATDTQFRGSAVYLNAGKDPVFPVPALFWMRDHYLNKHSFSDPKASPLDGDFTGLPPLMFHVGSTELLLDGSKLAHQKALDQDVDSKIKIWPKQPHVFPLIQFLPEAKQATQEIIDFMKSTL